MNCQDLENEEIARLVAYCIASDCEKGRRCFQEEFGKEASQSRTIRKWCKKIKETLSALPKSKKTYMTQMKFGK